jgi:hypothetical protein
MKIFVMSDGQKLEVNPGAPFVPTVDCARCGAVHGMTSERRGDTWRLSVRCHDDEEAFSFGLHELVAMDDDLIVGPAFQNGRSLIRQCRPEVEPK